MPKRSEIEAAQLLLRLIDARHGERPDWAVELAESEPTEDKPPAEPAVVSVQTWLDAQVGPSAAISRGKGLLQQAASPSRVFTWQDLAAAMPRTPVVVRTVFFEQKSDGTEVELYDDDFGASTPSARSDSPGR